MDGTMERRCKAGVATLALAVGMAWTVVGSSAAWARTAPEAPMAEAAVFEVPGSMDHEGTSLARREDGRRGDRRFDRRLGRREDRRLDRRLDRRVAALESVVAKKVKVEDKKGRDRDRLGLVEEPELDGSLMAKKMKIEDNKGRDRDRGLFGALDESRPEETLLAKKVKAETKRRMP